jgi:hypothetical protein
MEDKDKEILEWKEAARSEADEVNRLQAENNKLREALKFYAERDNYLLIEDRDKSDIELDFGNLAREALKEINSSQ